MSPAPLTRAALHDAALELELPPGRVSIREGLPKADETWDTVCLLEKDDAEGIDLEVGHCTDPDKREVIGYFIGLSVYHQQNPETNRVFHATMTVHPTRDQMVRLRDFLDFLLRQPDE